jgi:hypothetical protein
MWLGDLVRSAGAPVICAVVLIGLLAGWVAAGGGGTVSRVRIEITRAAIPVSSLTQGRLAGGQSGAYVTIRSVSGHPDELTGASSPAARQVLLTGPTHESGTGGRGPGEAGPGVRLAIPAHGVVALSPFGSDLVLVGERGLQIGQQVPLTLDFRDAGRVTVEAAVTAPGTP